MQGHSQRFGSPWHSMSSVISALILCMLQNVRRLPFTVGRRGRIPQVRNLQKTRSHRLSQNFLAASVSHTPYSLTSNLSGHVSNQFPQTEKPNQTPCTRGRRHRLYLHRYNGAEESGHAQRVPVWLEAQYHKVFSLSREAWCGLAKGIHIKII